MQKGCTPIPGGEWFVRQAQAQFKLFTGRTRTSSSSARRSRTRSPRTRSGPDPDARPRNGKARRSEVVALIGARCSGKTSAGRELAKRLRWTFVDLDEEIARADAAAREAGAIESAGKVLERVGEAAFRDLESRALAEVLDRPGPFVLATGGGVVEREENKKLLARRTTCVWLRVAASEMQRRLRADPTPRPALEGLDPVEELPRTPSAASRPSRDPRLELTAAARAVRWHGGRLNHRARTSAPAARRPLPWAAHPDGPRGPIPSRLAGNRRALVDPLIRVPEGDNGRASAEQSGTRRAHNPEVAG